MQRSDRDEAARLLADAARPLLGDERFSNERIDELPSAFVTDNLGEGEAQFAASLHQIGEIPGGQGT
jgi:hypothetical protein